MRLVTVQVRWELGSGGWGLVVFMVILAYVRVVDADSVGFDDIIDIIDREGEARSAAHPPS